MQRNATRILCGPHPAPSPQSGRRKCSQRDVLEGAETDASLFIYFRSRKHLDLIFTDKAGGGGGPGLLLKLIGCSVPSIWARQGRRD